MHHRQRPARWRNWRPRAWTCTTWRRPAPCSHQGILAFLHEALVGVGKIRSAAPLCPASHEGVFVKLLYQVPNALTAFNRHHRRRFQSSKAGGNRSSQRASGITWCDRSHLSAVARFQHRPRQSSRHGKVSPANLTSGGTASAPLSHIRDGRAPGGRHHSIRRRECTRPDNGDTPLDPWPELP